jgi:hypothetical protein
MLSNSIYERMVTNMGRNKQQVATEARAKKASTPEVQPQPAAAEQKAEVKSASTPAPAAQPAVASKQTQTIEKLRVALREQRQIEVKEEMLIQDGKYINLLIGEEWPTIRIGNSGGITVMELKSYTSAFEAAVKGDVLLAKQKEREGKKPTAAAPAQPAAKAPAEKQAVSA